MPAFIFHLLFKPSQQFQIVTADNLTDITPKEWICTGIISKLTLWIKGSCWIEYVAVWITYSKEDTSIQIQIDGTITTAGSTSLVLR